MTSLDRAIAKLEARKAKLERLFALQAEVDALENRRLRTDNDAIALAQAIAARVAAHYGLTTNQLISPERPEWIAFPRQVAMALIRDLLKLSNQKIATILRRRNHGSISHGCRVVRDRLETDPKFRLAFTQLKTQIQTRICSSPNHNNSDSGANGKPSSAPNTGEPSKPSNNATPSSSARALTA